MSVSLPSVMPASASPPQPCAHKLCADTVLLRITKHSSLGDSTNEYRVFRLFTEQPDRVFGDWAEEERKRGPELCVRWPAELGDPISGIAKLLAIGAACIGPTAPQAQSETVRTAPQAAGSAEEASALALLEIVRAARDEEDLGRACQAYLHHVARFGSIRAALGRNGSLGTSALANTRGALLLCALETNRGKPSGLLSESKPEPFEPEPSEPEPFKPTDIRAAALASLDELGFIDVEHIASALDTNPGFARREIVSAGIAFVVPAGCPSGLPAGSLCEASAYLSGDVRAKLLTARAAGFGVNARALEDVLPPSVAATDIAAGLGSAWIPANVFKEWCMSLFPGHRWGLRVEQTLTGWSIVCTNPKLAASDGAIRSGAFSGVELIEHAMNGRMPVAWRQVDSPKGPAKVRDEQQTVQAQARVQELRSAFEAWVFSDAARAERLCGALNETFNRYKAADPLVDHLRFKGLASHVGGKVYALRPHQLRGVAKILLGGTRDRSAFLIYPPGLGKTDPAICAAVKLTQQGRTRKTIFAVPAGVAGQWRERFLLLFPGLADELLAPDCPRFGNKGGAAGRNDYFARAADPGWRYVILTHEMLLELPLEPEPFAELLAEQVRDVRECLHDAEGAAQQEAARSAKRQLREREATLRKLSAAHANRWASGRVLGWSALGCDHLVLDEAHFAKSLGVATRMENVHGLPRGESQRAFDTFCKCQIVMRAGGRVTALSGTPLTNTLAEAWVWMSMLQPNLLRWHGLEQFDKWASVFAEAYPSVEMDAAGRFRTVTRLRFRNVPELVAMLGECWDFAARSGSQEVCVTKQEKEDYLKLNGKMPSCGNTKNRWNFCIRSIDHEGDCMYERVPSYGGDDRSMYGPD